jgi:hypothetical protein
LKHINLHGKTKATLSVWNEKLDMKKEYLLIELLQRVTKDRLIKTCMTEKLKLPQKAKAHPKIQALEHDNLIHEKLQYKLINFNSEIF